MIVSYPLPEGVGMQYRFGVVVAADIAAARTAVFNELVNTHGLDPAEHSEEEIVLSSWFGTSVPYGKTKLYNG